MSAPRPFKRGAVVAVINCTMGGTFLVESRTAVVLKRDGERYLVNINGDHVWRFLDRAAQANPGEHVRQLNEMHKVQP